MAAEHKPSIQAAFRILFFRWRVCVCFFFLFDLSLVLCRFSRSFWMCLASNYSFFVSVFFFFTIGDLSFGMRVFGRELVLICTYNYCSRCVSDKQMKQIGNNIELNNNVAKRILKKTHTHNILNYIIAFLLQMIGYQFFWVRFNYINWEPRKSFATAFCRWTATLEMLFFSGLLHSFACKVIISGDKRNLIHSKLHEYLLI